MKEQLLERFLRYVKTYTPSNEEGEGTPSSKEQFDLAAILEKEMKELGMEGVHVDEHCYVYGSLPATKECGDAPKLAFLAHMDTVSDFCAKTPNPLIHENYDGKDIFLPAGERTSCVKDHPHLAGMKGRTIITSDGTTILGADDKAGIAEILTMAQQLQEKKIPHGKLSFAFTPDEEIGSGAELLDLKVLDADFAYTADGDLEGGIEYETFNAASSKITINGISVHTGSAKDIMVNAAEIAAEYDRMLPDAERPRTTEGYEGFYHLNSINGAVEKAVLKYLLRDHDREKFEKRKKRMEEIAELLNEKYGAGTVSVETKDSYYNMSEILKDHMHLVETAKKAAELAGICPSVKPVRGGTDGARLSFRGLPCPNIGTGGSAFHGPYEHISLEGMEKAVQMLLHIVTIYAENKNGVETNEL